MRPEPGLLSHLPQETLHDLPAFQSALLRVPEAGMCGPSSHTSRYCYLSLLQTLLLLSPSLCQQAAHTREEAVPFSPLVDLLLQVLSTEGFDFIVHTTGLRGRGC